MCNGDVVEPGAAVRVLLGGGNELNLPFFSITGTGYTGHVTASICIRFNDGFSATENVVLDDAAGIRSNTIAIVIPTSTRCQLASVADGLQARLARSGGKPRRAN